MPYRFAIFRVFRIAAVAILLATVVASPPRLAADSWNDELASALDQAAANYWNPSILVALGTFTYAHEELASPFSRWLIDDLHGIIPRTKSLRLFDREAAAAMDPAFRQSYAALFDSAKVDAILYVRRALVRPIEDLQAPRELHEDRQADGRVYLPERNESRFQFGVEGPAREVVLRVRSLPLTSASACSQGPFPCLGSLVAGTLMYYHCYNRRPPCLRQ
ncbi:MAG TPA: hypothetical protein VMV83_00215 [Rectinemataceae bacterium]|nr:hypothetical protein [Rectinemataceae bacterium]